MTPTRPPPSIAARRLASALGAVAVLSLGSARPARAQPQPPPSSQAGVAATARDLFRKAAKEYKAGQVNEAYRDYLAAWNFQQSPDTAGNLGSIELELGYFRDAAQHAAYALAHFPPSGSKDQRAALAALLAEACRQIGTLTVQVNVSGAALSIDGKPLGRAPLDGDVYIEPGDHVVAAEAPDYQGAQQKVHVEKGSSTPVILALLPRSATQTPTQPTTNWPRPVAVAGFITSGLGYGVGTALAILAKIKADQASSLQSTIDKGKTSTAACSGQASSMQCTELAGDVSARSTFANAALWTFVGATAVAAGTLVYTFVVPRISASPPPAAALSIVPVVTPAGGAIVIHTTF